MELKDRKANESSRDYALRIIKNNIVSLNLEPNSRVNDIELGHELGLSRTPVREALLDLAKMDIVKMYPQRGSVIAPINYDIMKEAYMLREILECAVVERCCNIEEISVFEPLKENLVLQEFYLENRSADKLMELDNEFHRGLFIAAEMPHVHSLMGSMTIHFDRVRHLSYQVVKEVKTVSAHKKILNTILCHDRTQAVELMKKHLGNYTVEKEELVKQYPQYF